MSAFTFGAGIINKSYNTENNIMPAGNKKSANLQ
jgi:hypothetical protein